MIYELYVDGSYKNEQIGAGVLILDEDKQIVLSKAINLTELVKDSQTTYKNTDAELLGALVALQLSLLLGIKHIKVFYDFNMIYNLVVGISKPKSKTSKYYVKQYRLIAPKFESIAFEKIKSHSGNVYLSMVDRLGRLACDI